jgi:N-acetylmuramoyl-L-alanine amidase
MKLNHRLLIFALILFAVAPVMLSSDLPQCQSAPAHVLAAPQGWWDEIDLISRLVMGEAMGEPFTGKVAVAAVIINRTLSPSFPDTVPGVVYEIDAFESVTNGLIWSRSPGEEEIRAAEMALNGWDPTGGALFFWNPSKPVSPWIWSRQIIAQIGNHVFGR